MGAKKNSESESKSDMRVIAREVDRAIRRLFLLKRQAKEQEKRVIALERGLEAVLRRLEESGQPDDEPGWYGRPE